MHYKASYIIKCMLGDTKEYIYFVDLMQRVVKLKQYDENVYFNKVSAAVEQWNSQPAVSFSIFLTFNEEASEARLNKTPTSCR